MTKCIGYTFKQGSFEGITFDNILLYIVSDDDPDITGMTGSELKIKRSDAERILGGLQPSDLLNKEIELFYSLTKDKPKLRKITLADSVLFE